MVGLEDSALRVTATSRNQEDDEMARWRDGEMAGWRDGGMAGWQDGEKIIIGMPRVQPQ